MQPTLLLDMRDMLTSLDGGCSSTLFLYFKSIRLLVNKITVFPQKKIATLFVKLKIEKYNNKNRYSKKLQTT